jgi:hypothetical protein
VPTWPLPRRSRPASRSSSSRRSRLSHPDSRPLCRTIWEYWADKGGSEAFGVPGLTADQVTDEGPYANFSKGGIYKKGCLPVALFGAMDLRYHELGGPKGWLGMPNHEPYAGPGSASYVDFEKGGATLVESPAGIRLVYGAIRVKWRELDHVKGSLGYPVTDEIDSSDGTARLSRFKNGTICWTASTGAVVKEVGASCNAPAPPPPTCTPKSYDFCCAGSVYEDLHKSGCNLAEARAKFSSEGPTCAGYLYDGSCASVCPDAKKKNFCFHCRKDGRDVASQSCDVEPARTAAYAVFKASYGIDCAQLDQIECY